MNEKRQQAYFNLIQSLLNCRSHNQVQEILAANQELVDLGLLQSVEAAAAMFSQQGYENTANWLQGLAMQLKGWLNRDTEVDLQSLSEAEVQAYLQLLMELLQATAESWGNAQVVYPLLAKNTDKLDGVFAKILRRWGIDTLREAQADRAEYLAAVIDLFSNRIQQFRLGNTASNMEIAIAGYQVTLTVYTAEVFLYEWARTLNNLAGAYSNRIRGERAENLEQAIAYYQQALKIYTFDKFPDEWTRTQNNLAGAYLYRIRGERAKNIEQAIAYYQETLKVYTFDKFPDEWARTLNHLATAYRNRIRGERAENIEQAIACLQEALKVYTFDAFPQDWAMTQNNLGEAYLYRIQGERAENLELAITCLQEALKVDTVDNFPYAWATTQNNLGEAYRNRIRGERAENIEQAIAYYQQALKVRTLDAFPQDWAATQNNLALAYLYRIIGERAENIEQAITCYQQALKVRTVDAFPYEWAQTQNNLGLAYRNRIRGERVQNLELTINCFQEVLKVYTYDKLPEDWAKTKNNLGEAYLYRIQGERAENLELAIAYFQQAQNVITLKAFPQNWAAIQNNLASAYRNRMRGEQVQNLELAITYYQEVLNVYTFDAFPQDWAGTQYNLANAYFCRIRGKRAENLELAIACLQEVLKVDTLDAFPQNHTQTLFQLGRVYQEAKQFDLAYTTFQSAITTVESLREEIVSGQESKRKQAEEWNKLYSRMVEVCLELDKITEALEYVERSKTRNLVEQILIRDQKTIFPADVVTQLETYRDEIATGQYQIQNGKAENPKILAQHLQELRQQRNELQNHYLPVGYGFQFDSFQATLDERTAIIEWYILNEKILAFIVISTGETTVWQSQLEDLESFRNWVNQYLQKYDKQKYEWRNSLGEEIKKLAAILNIDELLTQIPKHCDQLILIPHRFLHLFPLHAISVSQNSENSLCLLDLFANGVIYAPSCQILQQLQKRKRPDFQSIFALQNPTEDLDYADLEVDNILKLLPSENQVLLTYKQANKNTLFHEKLKLNKANYLHFSCHGKFNLHSPLDSYLLLAESVDEKKYLDLSKCLTLGNLFEQDFQLDNCRLVVLSACETGLVDFTNISDEYISLPSGFFYAGSANVVSSLWTVDDFSTAFLMIKFSQNIKAAMSDSGDFSVAVELQKAQLWLRNATTVELQAWASELKLVPEQAKKIEKRLNWFDFDEQPFQNPYWWAGFCAIGQ